MADLTALDAAYAALQTGGEAEALRFYRLLADAPLCLLLAHEAEGEAIAPQVFDLSDGPMILAFDSEDRLAAFQDGPVPYASLPGRVIAQQMAGQGLWLGLNLGTGAPSETVLPPEAMAHLLDLLDVSAEVTEGQARSFAAPAVPAVVDEALRFALHAAAGLAAGAVLAGVTYEGGGRGHVLALVGAAEGAEPALARAVAEALSFAGVEAAKLDVVFLTPDDPALRALLRTGRAYDIPAPTAAQAPPTPAAPGSDPSRPPRLR
jgi:hypothetical protein